MGGVKPSTRLRENSLQWNFAVKQWLMTVNRHLYRTQKLPIRPGVVSVTHEAPLFDGGIIWTPKKKSVID